MRNPKVPDQSSSLTPEERRRILEIAGPYTNRASKLLGVGLETFAAIVDPHGRTSKRTVAKVKEKVLTLEKNAHIFKNFVEESFQFDNKKPFEMLVEKGIIKYGVLVHSAESSEDIELNTVKGPDICIPEYMVIQTKLNTFNDIMNGKRIFNGINLTSINFL